SYSEACELAYFGAKVVHPQTMAPAFAKQIPIWIRNTFAPEKPGTRIDAGTDTSVPVKGITTFTGLALLNLEGAGMLGVPGAAARLFSALARAQVNVRAIAQGSSERNISVAISGADATKALRAVHAGFYLSAQTLSIGLVGPGNVGRAVLAQIEAARPKLLERANLDLHVRAIAGRDSMSLDGGPAEVSDLKRFVDHVQPEHLPHAVVID